MRLIKARSSADKKYVQKKFSDIENVILTIDSDRRSDVLADVPVCLFATDAIQSLQKNDHSIRFLA